MKILQQQLEAERQHGAPPALGSGDAGGGQPVAAVDSSCNGVDADTVSRGGSSADVSGTCPPASASTSCTTAARPLASGSGTSTSATTITTTTISSILHHPLPWWQHALSLALTAASVGAYTAWEQRMTSR